MALGPTSLFGNHGLKSGVITVDRYRNLVLIIFQGNTTLFEKIRHGPKSIPNFYWCAVWACASFTQAWLATSTPANPQALWGQKKRGRKLNIWNHLNMLSTNKRIRFNLVRWKCFLVWWVSRSPNANPCAGEKRQVSHTIRGHCEDVIAGVP